MDMSVFESVFAIHVNRISFYRSKWTVFQARFASAIPFVTVWSYVMFTLNALKDEYRKADSLQV